MKTNIEIYYRHLPFEIIEDFKGNIEDASISITVTHDKEDYDNFTGGPADILIYIDKHLTELIVNGIAGLAGTAIYEGIKTTWKKLRTYYVKEQTDIQGDKNYISLNFNLKPDKTLSDDKIIKQHLSS